MEILIFIIWFPLAVAIPLFLVAKSYSKYFDGVKLPKIILKLLLAFLVYVPTTIITFSQMVFMLLIAIQANTEPNKRALSLEEMLFCSAMVLVYGVIGWLLCSLIDGSFVKPWVIFGWNSEKPLSIYDQNKL